jgi:hypothetical protein
MNKSGVVLILALCLLVFSGFALAENCTAFNYSSWGSCNAGVQTRTVSSSTPAGCTGGNPILNQTCTTTPTATPTSTVNMSRIDKGFACLADKVKSDCTGAKTIQEIALTILASPANVTQQCYDRLIGMKKTNCFGDSSSCDVKSTALAVLAISHVGQNTDVYESWLMNQTLVATDLIWYIEQDSNTKTTCKIGYNSQDYSFNVLENKKIDGSPGNCLSLANSNYWLQVSPACYSTNFNLVCDTDYIATLLYKLPNSPTLYVLSDTKSAQANQPVDLQVKSLCFGTNACSYEASAWATVALDKTGNNVESYLPYLIAGEDANKQYLPDAFLQILKDFSEYGTKLIQQQSSNKWKAENTAHNEYYDTALALIALSNSNQQQVSNAKTWLTNTAQGQDGCWNNDNIRDTAIALWALAGRTYGVVGPTSISECLDFGFFCIAKSQCPSGQDISNNYYCAALSQTCCKTENLQPCADLNGKICSSDKQCDGITKKASNAEQCCMGECQTTSTQSECELAGDTCRATCASTQTKTDSTCDPASFVCCKSTATPTPNGGSYWWIWVLVILIILVALAIVFKDRLKVYLYKMKSGFKEDKSGSSSGGGVPPGFGPYSSDKPAQQQQRPPMRPMSMPPQRPPQQQMNRPPMRR